MSYGYHHKIVASSKGGPTHSFKGIDLTCLRDSRAEFEGRPGIIRSILVVEDTTAVGAALQRGLGLYAEVQWTEAVHSTMEHALRALEIVAASSPDCVIVDGLWGEGPPLVQDLRAKSYQGWIVAFSDAKRLRNEMVHNGADWFVDKPFDNRDFYDPERVAASVARADRIRSGENIEI